jgi:hypothetical protein
MPSVKRQRHSKAKASNGEAFVWSIYIPRGAKLRPVQAVREWPDAAGITEGPNFRPVDKAGRISTASISAVPNLVKEY